MDEMTLLEDLRAAVAPPDHAGYVHLLGGRRPADTRRKLLRGARGDSHHPGGARCLPRPARRDSAAVWPLRPEWFSIVTILQLDPVVPPKLAAALFTAAEKIPGMALIDNVLSPAGAQGEAVALAAPWAGAGMRAELIFDPRSYRFIGFQDVATQATHGLAAGSVWDATAILTTKVVNTAPSNCQTTGNTTVCGSSVSSGSSSGSGSPPPGSSSSSRFLRSKPRPLSVPGVRKVMLFSVFWIANACSKE